MPDSDTICLSHRFRRISSMISRCRGESLSSVASCSHVSGGRGRGRGFCIGMAGFPKKKSADQDAHRTPARGYTERTLAGTPFGARQSRHCFCIKIWRIPAKQRLDARASIQIVTVGLATDSSRIIPDPVLGVHRQIGQIWPGRRRSFCKGGRGRNRHYRERGFFVKDLRLAKAMIGECRLRLTLFWRTLWTTSPNGNCWLPAK